MKNEIISINVVKRQQFNSFIIKTDDSRQFLAYYVAVLVTAQQFGLITKYDCEIISQNILSAFQSEFENSPLVMANNMYVLTSYLKAQENNFNQLSELIGATNSAGAKELFEKSGKWLKKKVGILNFSLFVAEKEVILLNDNVVKVSYNMLKNMVKELDNCLSTKTKVNLKLLHYSGIGGMGYDCAISSDAESYIDRLVSYTNNFLLELKMLNRLKAHELIDKIEVFCEETSEVSDQDKKIQEVEKQIAILKQKYRKAKQIVIQRQQEEERKYLVFENKMRRKFRLEHPDIKGEAFEEAFEVYMDNVSEEYEETNKICDLNVLEKAYRNRLHDLEERLETLENECNANQENTIIDWKDVCLSLKMVVKLTAVSILLEKGEIQFERIPATVEELEEMLYSFSIQEAVDIVLERISFSEEELSYLRKIKD